MFLGECEQIQPARQSLSKSAMPSAGEVVLAGTEDFLLLPKCKKPPEGGFCGRQEIWAYFTIWLSSPLA